MRGKGSRLCMCMQAPTRKGQEGGSSLGDRLARACRTLAVAALKDSRMNVSCFREAAGAGAGQAAGVHGSRLMAREGSGSSFG